MQAGQGKVQEELKEVEEELDAADGSIPMRHMEQGILNLTLSSGH